MEDLGPYPPTPGKKIWKTPLRVVKNREDWHKKRQNLLYFNAKQKVLISPKITLLVRKWNFSLYVFFAFLVILPLKDLPFTPLRPFWVVPPGSIQKYTPLDETPETHPRFGHTPCTPMHTFFRRYIKLIWRRTFVAMQSYQGPEAPRQTFHNTIFAQTLKASYFETSAHIIRVCPTFGSIFLMFCFSRETIIPSMPSLHSETRRNTKITIHTELAIPVVFLAVLHKKFLNLY